MRSFKRRSTSKQRGGGDVLEVDAAKAAGDVRDGVHDDVDVGRVDAQRKGVDVGERLEQRALPLHDGHARNAADVAQAEHRRPVGDDRDEVPPGACRCTRDPGRARSRGTVPRPPRRVGDREVFARLEAERGSRPRSCRATPRASEAPAPWCPSHPSLSLGQRASTRARHAEQWFYEENYTPEARPARCAEGIKHHDTCVPIGQYYGERADSPRPLPNARHRPV